MSYNGTDNGYASFDHVRIPRTHLLMRNASLTRDGTYKKALHDKLSYSTLIYVRTFIVRNSAFQLAQALTIATRYSHVREQGLGPNGGLSHQVAIITYKSQHFRLLSLISKCYAIHFAWRVCNASYWELIAQQSKNDHSALPYNHMIAAGLKAWATEMAAGGAEDARKCCGGQGYVDTSGLPEIVSAVTAMATFEGENWVMWQQVFRYLFKGIMNIKAGKPVPKSMEYIAESYHYRKNERVLPPRCTSRGNDLLSPDVLTGIYRHRACRLVFEAFSLLSSDTNISPTDAWNTHMMSLIRAARAHIDVFVISSFASKVAEVSDSEIRLVLDQLVSLSALTSIISPSAIDAISFVEDGYLYMDQLQDARNQVNKLLSQLLPNSIALTDAWNFTDASLCSAIGQYDGNAYETLMKWTEQLPININAAKTGGIFLQGFQESIKPVLKGVRMSGILESDVQVAKLDKLDTKAKL
jgi:acyl-CoA oxidase